MPDEPTFETLIRGGLVVTAERTSLVDIGIVGETITGIAPGIDSSTSLRSPAKDAGQAAQNEQTAARVIDATGKLVFPGVVDVHVHPIYMDDLCNTSVSAAFGGVTTMVHYAYVKPGQQIIPTLEKFRDEGLRDSLLDFGMHAGLFDVANQIQDVPAAFKIGVTSFKVFMTYAKLKWMTDDYWITALMDVVAQERGLARCQPGDGVE